MIIRKLSTDIQSLMCASTQINSFKRAVEELVYNSLDAESTSIAIRVDIEENAIQVIDNGDGVAKCNFNLLGQRYATSRCVDLSTLKSIPSKYGFRGQSLANIIEVSQTVKITSRCENSEETWVKTFNKGKEEKTSATTKRPSKGTTVEIKSFLYNLNIQKKALSSLNEMRAIITFLEQLSLVHQNISLSLRDDPRNEILFKLHKNRDIYQTLSSLFGVEKTDLQELKIEKNQYKVTAFIEKKDRETKIQYRWIYLNGKFVQSPKLYALIKMSFTKCLRLNCQPIRKSKSKICEENGTIKNKIPSYFIFLSCPYYDYDLSYLPKESVLEFKNWEVVNKLIEKLIKFYRDDSIFKEISKSDIHHLKNKSKGTVADTRDQVKKIIEKILGSNPRKPGVSQMQNGIKGKLIKRKTKKKTLPISLSNIIPQNNIKNYPKNRHNGKLCENEKQYSPILAHKSPNLHPQNKLNPNKQVSNKKNNISHTDVRGSNLKNRKKINKPKKVEPLIVNTPVIHKKIVKTSKHKVKKSMLNNKQQKSKLNKENTKILQDPLVNIFEKEYGSIKRRCDALAKKVDGLMSYEKRWKGKIIINETVQYSSVTNNDKNGAGQKIVGGIVIHDYVPPKYSPSRTNIQICQDAHKKPCKSSYDLVHTILKSQQISQSYNKGKQALSSHKVNQFAENKCINTTKESTVYNNAKAIYTIEPQNFEDNTFLTKLTYESHEYYQDRNLRSDVNYPKQNFNRKITHSRFITKQSRDNFMIPESIQNFKNQFKIKLKKPHNFQKPYEHRRIQFNYHKTHNKSNHQNLLISSCTIECSKSNENDVMWQPNNEISTNSSILCEQRNNGNETYTIDKDNELKDTRNSILIDTYTICDTPHLPPQDSSVYQNNSILEVFTNKTYESQKTYSIQEFNNLNLTQHNMQESNHNEIKNKECNGGDNRDIVFVSKSQISIDKDLEPIHFCETILNNHDSENTTNSNRRRCHDTVLNGGFGFDSFFCNRSVLTFTQSCQVIETHKTAESSHPLDLVSNCDMNENDPVSTMNDFNDSINLIATAEKPDYIQNNEKITTLPDNQHMQNAHEGIKLIDDNIFNLKNRLNFVPKGMSPIFDNCQTNNICNYNLEQDYFEQAIYKNFANDVTMNAEIFEPRLHNLKELTTKDIEKVNNRLEKDNASLIFNGELLKQAKVLGQVDDKFIAAKMKGRFCQLTKTSEFLVLFDQHAVHERIRLEKNLADYITADQWKSITLDEISFKLRKEEILYLHNFKDKFTQFGLQWTINNSEIKINAIPEAILGKNARQAEIVINAIRNLISEEINVIKSQKGCVLMYPKSMMELVFSEACRYAIKFGDKLSRNDCVELLNSLSDCKTPFQCAHGRPVMAVILDITNSKREYKINVSKIRQFVKNLVQVNINR